LYDLDDSKRLDAPARARLADVLLAHAPQVVVRVASPATIDRHGLHVTNLRLLGEALAALDPCPDVALVDGFRLGPSAPAHRAVPGGDRRSAAIAAASIIAKTTRDRLMAGPVAEAHPDYGFERNVGYATADHREAILRVGPSAMHRRSFRSPSYPWVGGEATGGLGRPSSRPSSPEG
jgi:ribonuclease HII